jgi:hypothetical protein
VLGEAFELSRRDDRGLAAYRSLSCIRRAHVRIVYWAPGVELRNLVNLR